MKYFPHTNNKAAIAAAIAVTLGSTAPIKTASAVEYVFEWDGLFTMLTATGIQLQNNSYPYYGDPTWGYGLRTQITGTLTYDDVTGLGSMTINDFEFFDGNQPAQAQTITLENIGNGGTADDDLLLANMLFNWNGNNGIPVSAVFDASGLLNAITAGINISETVDGTAPGSAIPASNNIAKSKYPIGPAPVATTTYDTNNLCTDLSGQPNGDCMTVNPSGSEPISSDTIGGDPMIDGPFTDFNANFDITSLTLLSRDDIAVSIEAPADITVADVPETPFPRNEPINLGAPVSFAPGGATIEYCIGTIPNCTASGPWTANNGTNAISVPLNQTVNTLTVAWRADDGAGGLAFDSQSVSISIDDNTLPTFPTVPADFSVTVNSTADPITFEGPTSGHGIITASDNVDPTLTIQWSLDGLNWTNQVVNADESSNAFASGINTIFWRVTDDSGNRATYEQRVTVNLPTGITGQPCTVDTDMLNTAIGNRQLEGTFTMRNSSGTIVGTVDPFVVGSINTSTVCASEACSDSGASLSSPTPFYGNLWTTNTIRLFDQPGHYSFNTVQDNNPSLNMTVGSNQLGAHMLFDWSVNRDIDVVLVWDFGCGSAELVTTDPDGDGIIGTKMVDGPFKGFNAAFDLSTTNGSRPITTGGYSVTIPTVNNPVANTSPLPINAGSIGTTIGGITITDDELRNWGAGSDQSVSRSCVGGCFDFTVSGRTTGETIRVVLPLSEPIPYYSLYRKYNASTDSWSAYVVNGTDNVMTASLNSDGRCPEPGAGDYTSYTSGILAGMLRPNDQCIQLTITDNGPNDSDATDGVIADPSGVGMTSGPASPEAITSGGGCSISAGNAPTQRLDLWILGGLLGLIGLYRKRQQN